MVKKFVTVWGRENIHVCATQIASPLFAMNNKSHVIQRGSYGLHDEAYSHLKILTCTPRLI